MDRIEEWQLFASVASKLSFAATARTFGRSPQSVTRAIAALERRLGTRLLNRTTRAVSLTAEGARYFERSARALAEFELLEAAPDARAELGGALSVTAPVLFGQLHVMPLVAEFLHRHAGLRLRLLLVDRVVSLAEEGMDVGVRIGGLPDSSLRARQVGQVRSVVCASPTYLAKRGVPRDPSELVNHDGIVFTATTPIAERWPFFSAGARRERSVSVKPRLSVNTGQAAIDAACAGLGVVRVLSYQVERLVRQNALVIVLDAFEPEPVPVQIVRLPGVPARAATAFADFASERLRSRLAPFVRRRRR